MTHGSHMNDNNRRHDDERLTEIEAKLDKLAAYVWAVRFKIQ